MAKRDNFSNNAKNSDFKGLNRNELSNELSNRNNNNISSRNNNSLSNSSNSNLCNRNRNTISDNFESQKGE